MAWLAGWSYRKKLTIDSGDIDAALTDFPVLIKVTAARIPKAKVVSANGYDVVFTASNGTTLLKHELVWWNDAANTGEFWVKIPSIASGADTDFYVYYGKAAQGDTTSTDTWDSNFEAVYHLQSGGSDSSGNGNNLTVVGATNVSCYIGNGYSFDGNDKLYHAATAMATTDTQRTIECWTKIDNHLSVQVIANSDNAGTIMTRHDGGNWKTFGYSGGGWMTATAALDATGTWYHRASVYTRNTAGGLIHYKDGSPAATGNTDNTDLLNGGGGTNDITIGSAGNDTQAFSGDVDEVRYSLIARTAPWLKATYETGRDNLLSYGSEESPVVAPTVTTQAVTNILYNTATGNGNITATGGENCHTRGICWSTSPNPTTADSKAEDNGGGSYGTGAFSKGITSLTTNTTYHVRAYAINSAGTSYGGDVQFTTLFSGVMMGCNF